MDSKHHCNGCPHWYVTHKKYPSGFYNITICGKYNKQLYYMAGEENQTPHPCNICAEQFSYIPYIEQILDGVEQVTERLSANCPCNKCGKDKKCVLAKEACKDFLKWEDNCIKKLAEYETTEEEGKLLIFPVALGDKVYVINKYVNSGEWHLSNYEHIVTDILLNRNRGPLFRITNRCGTEKFENFGKTVFLTREEAKKALKEMEGKSK